MGGRVGVCLYWYEQPDEFYCDALGVGPCALWLNARVVDEA